MYLPGNSLWLTGLLSSLHKCNTTAIQVFYNCCKWPASFLQVVENLYCSVVLQGSTEVQYNCNTIKKFLYCSCIVVVLHLCGLL